MLYHLKAFKTDVFRPKSKEDARQSCLHALSLVPALATGRCFDDMMRSRAVCMAIYAGALDEGIKGALGISEKEWLEAMGKPLKNYLPHVDFSKDRAYAPALRPEIAQAIEASWEREPRYYPGLGFVL